eukprot:m.94279 g.94279  ORF g.94279 m.94279 type:complete len:179 (+) comp13438_c0_seq2:74-610(+)
MAGLGPDIKNTGEASLAARLTGTDQKSVGVCKKCGFAGHLTFQCRNVIKSTPQVKVETKPSAIQVDVSSTSSDDSDDDLKDLGSSSISESETEVGRDGRDIFGRDVRRGDGKQKKRYRHSSRDRRDRGSSDSEDDSEDEKERSRKKRRTKKEKKKSKKEKKSKSKSKHKKKKKSKRRS